MADMIDKEDTVCQVIVRRSGQVYEKRMEEEAKKKEKPCLNMMKLCGHTKYDTFKRYVRISLDEYADDIAKSADNCLF